MFDEMFHSISVLMKTETLAKDEEYAKHLLAALNMTTTEESLHIDVLIIFTAQMSKSFSFWRFMGCEGHCAIDCDVKRMKVSHVGNLQSKNVFSVHCDALAACSVSKVHNLAVFWCVLYTSWNHVAQQMMIFTQRTKTSDCDTRLICKLVYFYQEEVVWLPGSFSMFKKFHFSFCIIRNDSNPLDPFTLSLFIFLSSGSGFAAVLAFTECFRAL